MQNFGFVDVVLRVICLFTVEVRGAVGVCLLC
jgi:hypothetical protein